MMSVKEYAIDVNLSVEKILELCKKLDMNVSLEDDMLDDEMIIILDNEIANIDIEDEVIEETIDEEFEDDFEDSYVEELEEVKPNKPKKKIENKTNNNNTNEYKKQRKEMYKHKEKLQSNIVEDNDNIILYTEGMSVSEFANLLNISASEVIKKVMGLGLFLNINAAIDFETAEIIASEYSKELKRFWIC